MYSITKIINLKGQIMNLTEELTATKQSFHENVPPEAWDIMERSTKELLNQHLSQNALTVGDTIPSIVLPNANNKSVSIESYLDKGPIILSFYRGGWCPYCNLELQALQEKLPEFKALGASLITITPETADNSLNTSQKNSLEFEVLSDIGNIVARKFGLVFQMPEDLRELYHSFDLHVDQHNGDKDYELPMPATYVIGSDKKIIYAFVPEDYTQRTEPQVLVEFLKTL